MNRKPDKLENLKKDNIAFFSDYEWFFEWENFLTLDYWKDWRNKILAFQTEEEIDFYTQRLDGIAYAIWKSKKYGVREAKELFKYHYFYEKHGMMEGRDHESMIKEEESRLQNISHEDWKKEYRFSYAHLDLKEMSTEEINQNFGKKIKDKIGKRLDWTKEQLTEEKMSLDSNNNPSPIVSGIMIIVLLASLVVYKKIKKKKEIHYGK